MNYKQNRVGDKWRKPFSAFVVSLLLFGQIFAQTVAPATASLSATEKEIADKITVARSKNTQPRLLRRMEGRGTMQPGGEKAANWIADKIRSSRLKPLGDRGYCPRGR